MPDLNLKLDEEIETENAVPETPEEPEVEDRGDFLPDDEPEAEAEAEAEPEAEAEAEPEAEAEAEAEAEPEAEEAEPAAESEKPVNIPKSRFDEVNHKRKDAEDKLRDMEVELAVLKDRQNRTAPAEKPEPKFDFDAKEQDYMNAVLDGDAKLAQTLRNEIRVAEKQEYIAEASNLAKQSTNQTRAEIEFETAADQLVSDYAEFQNESESFDQTKLDEVIELKDAYVAAGLSGAKALRRAAEIAMRGIPKVGDQKAVEETPVKKKKTDVAKNIKTAKKQPPRVDSGDSNGTSSTFNIEKATDEEIEALPDSKRKELRGDFL